MIKLRFVKFKEVLQRLLWRLRARTKGASKVCSPFCTFLKDSSIVLASEAIGSSCMIRAAPLMECAARMRSSTFSERVLPPRWSAGLTLRDRCSCAIPLGRGEHGGISIAVHRIALRRLKKRSSSSRRPTLFSAQVKGFQVVCGGLRTVTGDFQASQIAMMQSAHFADRKTLKLHPLLQS